MSNSSRVRAVAHKENTVGMERHHLYKGAFNQINKAIEQGFYLEAIALLESLISDRLESRLNHISGLNSSFKTLEKLIKEIEKNEIDQVLKNIVVNEVFPWKDSRNKALHEMAKMESGQTEDWETRMGKLKPIAQKGLEVFRKVDRRYQKIK